MIGLDPMSTLRRVHGHLLKVLDKLRLFGLFKANSGSPSPPQNSPVPRRASCPIHLCAASPTRGREPVMKEKVRFLGLDVHTETIAVAVAEPDGEVRSLGTIPNVIDLGLLL